VASRYGFEVHEHKHELYGLCAQCRKAGVKVPGGE
jgi:Fe2+ or Zn2+ uptake regulation protein